MSWLLKKTRSNSNAWSQNRHRMEIDVEIDLSRVRALNGWHGFISLRCLLTHFWYLKSLWTNAIVDVLETHCDEFRICENYLTRVSMRVSMATQPSDRIISLYTNKTLVR